MQTTKVLQTVVSLLSPEEHYSGNIQAVVLDNLRQRFENTCYRSILIKTIEEVVEMDFLIYSRERQDASANCNVRFRVSGLVVRKGSLLHDCVVEKIDQNGHIISENPYASVYIKADPALQTIRSNQSIVARVGNVRYKIGQSHMSVNALPFIPFFRKPVIYKITMPKDDNMDMLDELKSQLHAEQKANTELNPEVMSYFSTLMKRYRSDNVFNAYLKATSGKVISLSELYTLLKKHKPVMISLPDSLNVDPAKFQVVYHDSKLNSSMENPLNYSDLQQTTNENMVIKEDFNVIVGTYIQRRIEEVVDLRQLCTSYNTMATVKKNDNIWKIYARYRRA
jgi:hypothetical protein